MLSLQRYVVNRATNLPRSAWNLCKKSVRLLSSTTHDDVQAGVPYEQTLQVSFTVPCKTSFL